MNIPPALQRILLQTPVLENAFLVGGCVRDSHLNIPTKDFDIEVYGVDYPELQRELKKIGRTECVGRSFGVIKVHVEELGMVDFSLPRKDSKVGPGHGGFAVSFSANLPQYEAASRRDFTINSMMFDPRQHRLIDHFGGKLDLETRSLRHTSQAFVEDPLRVLRGMQFIGRFELRPVPETLELCRSIKNTYAELPIERVWEEWFKWSTKSIKPSAGIKFLVATGWIDHFPELARLAVYRNPIRPDPSIATDSSSYTCLDRIVRTERWKSCDPWTRCVMMFSTLLVHLRTWDLDSHAHSPAIKIQPARSLFLDRIGCPKSIQARVMKFLEPNLVLTEPLEDATIRRLSYDLAPESIQDFVLIQKALNHTTDGEHNEGAIRAAEQRAHELGIQHRPPQRIITSRHLTEVGIQPGIAMGDLLRRAYEAQLNGVFGEETSGMAWLIEQLKLK